MGHLLAPESRCADAAGKKRWEIDGVDTGTGEWKAHREALERHESFRDFEYPMWLPSANGAT